MPRPRRAPGVCGPRNAGAATGKGPAVAPTGRPSRHDWAASRITRRTRRWPREPRADVVVRLAGTSIPCRPGKGAGLCPADPSSSALTRGSGAVRPSLQRACSRARSSGTRRHVRADIRLARSRAGEVLECIGPKRRPPAFSGHVCGPRSSSARESRRGASLGARSNRTSPPGRPRVRSPREGARPRAGSSRLPSATP